MAASPYGKVDQEVRDAPAARRITASGAAVSHKEVPKCITAGSHAPSATDKISVPAPPAHGGAAVFERDRLRRRQQRNCESPVVTIGRRATRRGIRAARRPPAPAPARPHRRRVGAQIAAGKGRPIAPATGRPPTATSERLHVCGRSSACSRVPSSRSTKIVTASSATLAAPASSGHRSRRRLGTSSGHRSGAESSSSLMWTPGHAFCSAATIAACAARSASVRYWPASSCSSFASMIVSVAAPPLTRCACTRRISAQPRSEASTHVLSSSSSLTLCGDAMVKAWAGRRSQEAINCSAVQASSDAATLCSRELGLLGMVPVYDGGELWNSPPGSGSVITLASMTPTWTGVSGAQGAPVVAPAPGGAAARRPRRRHRARPAVD